MVSHRQAIIQIISPILLGILAFFLIVGTDQLIPTNISWIRSGDGAQHYLGWDFFRNDAWHFPLGLNPKYGADIGSSIVFSDSIPLFAIPFKLIEPLLPQSFQYFGIWTLLCFILQAWFSWLLVSLISKSTVIRAISCCLFLFSPAMLLRINLHAALVAHFLILAGLYLNFSQNKNRQALKWCLLLIAAMTIHFYLFFAIAVLWLTDFFDRALVLKKPSLKNLTIELLSTPLLVLLFAWQIGYLSNASNSTVMTHYGVFSPNLLVFFNPDGWSYVLKNFYQPINEEFSNFLGLGILLLILLSIFCKYYYQIPLWPIIKRYLFLALGLLFLFTLALSNHLQIGQFVIDYPLPQNIALMLGSIRNSGRFLWPIIYCLNIIIIYIIVKSFPKYAALILGLCLSIQIVDTSAKWTSIRNDIARTSQTPSIFMQSTEQLKNPFWLAAAAHYNSILAIPLRNLSVQFFENGENWDWHRFASYAAKYHLSTNMVYLSRPDENKINTANKNYEAMILNGEFNKNSFYVLDNEKILPALISLDSNKDLFARIDEVNVLAPSWKLCKSCPQIPADLEFKKSFQIPEVNKKFLFSKGGDGVPFLIGIGQFNNSGRGWSFPEAWGVWSEGRESRLVIPLPKSPFTSLTLEVNPLLSPKHIEQTVQIWIDGDYALTSILKDGSHQIILPLNTTQRHRSYVSISLLFFNQIKPKDIDFGSDDRVLAIGLLSGIFQ